MGPRSSDVARRNGVARQTVHDWLRAYAASGLAGLADRSSKPGSCPHQMPAAAEGGSWRCAGPIRGGARRGSCTLGLDGVDPVLGRCRCIGAWFVTV